MTALGALGGAAGVTELDRAGGLRARMFGSGRNSDETRTRTEKEYSTPFVRPKTVHEASGATANTGV